MNQIMKHIETLSSLIGVTLLAAALQGCAVVAAGAVGAAAGYVASEQGYEVRSPVVHTQESERRRGAQ